jgi:hypothetical protein
MLAASVYARRSRATLTTPPGHLEPQPVKEVAMPDDDIALKSLPKSKSRPERIFAVAGDWAVGADSLQWILYRRRTREAGPYWNAVSFVRSTKDILARCMREKGTDERSAVILLEGLPDTFGQWKASQSSPEADL